MNIDPASSYAQQIATLESELMQLMKQNNIQVNNNNSNSAESLHALPHSPTGAAAQGRGQFANVLPQAGGGKKKKSCYYIPL